MSLQAAATQSFAKQAALLLLCFSVPAGNASASSMLQLVMPVIAAAKNKGNPPTGRQWRTPERISADIEESVYYSDTDIAFDASGNAIAVWQHLKTTQNVLGANVLWTNRYVAGSGWGTAEMLSDSTRIISGGCKVASDSSGNAIAVWADYGAVVGSETNIYARRYVPGSGWSATQTISSIPTGIPTPWVESNTPKLAVDAAGNAIAAWTQCIPVGMQQGCAVWTNRYTAGSGWGTAQLISDGTHEAAIAGLAVDAAGNAIALYHQEGDMLASRYVPGSGWGMAQLVVKAEGAGIDPDIAFDAAGNAIAVWGRGYAIVSNRYVAGSGWGTAQVIATFDSAIGAYMPQVAVDAAGNAIAVWRVDSNNSYHIPPIWASRYVAGSGWSTAQSISEYTGAFEEMPLWSHVGIDAAGNAIAVWPQTDLYSLSYSIMSNRYVAGSGWGTPQQVFYTEHGDGAWDAHVAVAPAGNAIAIWMQNEPQAPLYNSPRYIMSAARFE